MSHIGAVRRSRAQRSMPWAAVISSLVRFARELSLRVEVQTNAHHTPKEFLKELQSVELVGLSLDGPNATVHDEFRNKIGNFERVLGLLRQLQRWNVPVIVRTLVAKSNYESVHLIGHVLKEMENLARWSLLEFSPVGGYFNRDRFLLDRKFFRAVTERLAAGFRMQTKLTFTKPKRKQEPTL